MTNFKINKINSSTVYIGNLIEFLEFGLFASLLPFISKEIFINISGEERQLLSYLILYIGFLGRPFGSFFLGKLGDKYGSFYLLVISVFGISLTTFFIAFSTLFHGAVFIMSALRFLQGAFTGAEQAAASVILTTVQNKFSAYKNVAFLTASGIMGFSIAQIISTYIPYFGNDNFSWRASFILVAALGLTTFYKRFKSYYNMRSLINVNPLKKSISFKGCKRKIASLAVLVGVVNSFFYLITTYINSFSMIFDAKINEQKMIINLLSTLFFSAFILFWGNYVERVKTKPYFTMKWLLLIIACFVPFIFFNNTGFLGTVLIQMFFVAIVQLLTLLVLTNLPLMFDEAIRVSATGLAISIGCSVIGGIIPLISTFLTAKSGYQQIPLVYIFILLFAGYISLNFIYKEKNETLVSEA